MGETATYWVIFAGHEKIGRPGTRYVTPEGTITHEKKLAAKFITYADAEEFAKSQNIRVDGLTRYISHDDFEDSDLAGCGAGSR